MVVVMEIMPQLEHSKLIFSQFVLKHFTNRIYVEKQPLQLLHRT